MVEKFGEKYFYKWWVKSCESLGIEGVDLFGGARHSSVIALWQYRTPEEIKRATMYSTNKAFERYCRIESDDLRSFSQDTVMRKEKAGKVVTFPRETGQIRLILRVLERIGIIGGETFLKRTG
jgi:hypothetical protein